MAGGERRPRTDALRNRERLINTAKTAFAELGPEVSLEEIARRAEVGIGTLYRHFPTRDAIVAAVYRREVDHLAAAAGRLLTELPPREALRQWLRLCVDYLATKKVIAAALTSGDTSALYEPTAERLKAALGELLGQGIAAGELRPDVETQDIIQALAGLAYEVASPGWKKRALRLIDILTAGLAPGAA